MHHLSAKQFIVFGVIVSLLIAALVYAACDQLFMSALTPDNADELARNGKTINKERFAFGFTPTLCASICLSVIVTNNYRRRYPPRTPIS